MPDRIREVQALLDKEHARTSSIELQVRDDQSFASTLLGGQNAPWIDRIDTHYVETAAGQRLLDTRTHLTDGREGRQIAASEGRKCTKIVYHPDSPDKQTQIMVDNRFSSERPGAMCVRPEPLRSFYVGLTPIREALRDARLEGATRILARDCDTFRMADPARKTNPVMYDFHLDRSTATPLGVDVYYTPETFAQKRANLSWRATEVQTIDGRLVAVRSETRAFERKDPAKLGSVLYTQKYQVSKITFNRAFPESTFKPALDPGVTIYDSIENRQYPAPGQPKAKPQEATKALAPPPQAPAPGGSALPTAGIGLGIALLVGAAVVRFRRG